MGVVVITIFWTVDAFEVNIQVVIWLGNALRSDIYISRYSNTDSMILTLFSCWMT